MSIFIRLLSALLTALPAAVHWKLIANTLTGEYYGKTYLIVSEIFLAASLVLGFFVPAILRGHWKRHPILWLFGQGLLAWLVAVVALAVLNLTPLCIGQDNGDGSNDFFLCLIQSVMVPIVFSPLEFILLLLTTFPGGWLIKRLVRRKEG